MKLALITDPKGFSVLDKFQLSYHLVLAHQVVGDARYAKYYQSKHDKGDFIIMDNGAAEDGTLSAAELVAAGIFIRADEIVLPDVLGDMDGTIKATTNERVLDLIPPKQRAVVPQGNTRDEWLTCANYFASSLDFATLCIPKHTERFKGGRVSLLEVVHRLGWHRQYNIHLLGIWEDPYYEPLALAKAAPWVRGIDSAAPFALAQHGIKLTNERIAHVAHTWGRTFNKEVAIGNIATLLTLVGGFE